MPKDIFLMRIWTSYASVPTFNSYLPQHDENLVNYGPNESKKGS